jgi:hypothetical protein
LLLEHNETAFATRGDFRLIDRKALDAFRSMREQDRFVRGMFTWVGFRQTAIEFERAERAAGETKWPVGKLVRLAVSGLVSFSDAPLRLALWLGRDGHGASFGRKGLLAARRAGANPGILPQSPAFFSVSRHGIAQEKEHEKNGAPAREKTRAGKGGAKKTAP